MKKIITVLTFCLMSQLIYSQSITDFSAVSPILCDGDLTTASVTTTYNGNNLEYDLSSFNQTIGIWLPYPGYPVTGGGSLSVPNLMGGQYRIIISLNGLDLDTAELTLISPQPIQLFPNNNSGVGTNNVSCNGGNDGEISITVTGGTPNYTLNLSNNQTVTPTFPQPGLFSNLTAGNYSCNITDANGCQYSGNPILITISEPPTSISGTISTSPTSCFGGSDGSATAVPSGGLSPYNYLWSDGQTTQTATNLTSGSYNCLITDANGCQFLTNNQTVSEPSLINLLNS